jgi:hypothetical protein
MNSKTAISSALATLSSAVVSLASTVECAKADLGGADITGPSGTTTTGRSYEARCGANKDKCMVSFQNEKLIVNNEGGIYRDQLLNLVLKKDCTQRSLLLPWVTSCFENQLDWTFTITYRSNEGETRSALITFMPRYLATGATDKAREFERDLQIWMEDVIRPIGPSIQLESPKPLPPSRRPASKENDLTCAPPVSGFGCSWANYLKANPRVRAWAEANPAMAEQERLRLGAHD